MNARLIVVLLSAVVATPSAASAQEPTAESLIRAIVADQTAAWNAGDGEAHGRHLSDEASFTNLFGMVMYGKSVFVARQKEILATFYKATTKHQAIRKIRFVTPDVAIVVIKTQLMQVFVRRGGRWWVEAYHNVDTKPAAAR